MRAICGLPLGSPELLQPAAMANLLGDLWEGGEPDWAAALAFPDVKLHLYGKSSARPGRKMGHLTALGVDAGRGQTSGARGKGRASAPERTRPGELKHGRATRRPVFSDRRKIGAGIALVDSMTRGLRHSLSALSVVALLAANVGAAGPTGASPVLLQRFLSLDDPTPTQFRALRHLEARNDKFEKSAWMDVWTEADASGFRYQIVCEDGSDYIRSKVFRASLDAERDIWASGAPDEGALTPANYVFEERGAQPDGLVSLAVKPRRKGILLDRRLDLSSTPTMASWCGWRDSSSKTPSFWTRRVEIVRWYQRIAGFRMPTSLESVANIRIAGVSTFRMTYEYESINGQHVGNPQPRTLARATSR